MVRSLLLLVSITFLHGCSKTPPTDKKDDPANIPVPPEVAVADRKRAAQDDAAFAVDLYAQLRKTEGNLIFSPASISMALAMTEAGAGGQTSAEMKKALHLTVDDDRRHAVSHSRLYHWNGVGNPDRPFELSVANSLWGQKGEPWTADFIKLMNERYAAGLRQVDFVGATEESRKSINGWVDHWTRGKIADIIPPGILTNQTRMVLANAVYFKGKWQEEFPKRATRDQDFLTGGKTIKVPMMFQQDRFRYGNHVDVQVLELPYKGDKLSMVVILPVKRDGLADVEGTLTPALLENWLTALHREEVKVWLPRFKFESALDLPTTLQALGMKSAFDPQSADFSRMNTKTELYISNVLHKAMIETNEEGSEAAAATVVVMEVKSEAKERPPAIPVFRADHPFLFVIRENQTGDILFLGRVSDPSK